MRTIFLVAQLLWLVSLSHASPQTAVIHYLPLASTSGSLPLAIISYDPAAVASSFDASIESFTPPTTASSSSADYLVRIGIAASKVNLFASNGFEGSTTLTSLSALLNSKNAVFQLLLSPHGDEILSISYHAAPGDASLPAAVDQVGPRVEVLKSAPAPRPVLNKPVVLSSDGKLAEEAPEKPLWMKYWWVGAAFVMLLMMGGGDSK